MWQALGRLGFTGGDVLEPGCGSGHLIGMAPAGARMVGVERDPTSAGIAALLYPHARVVTGSFADLDADEASFDVAIGNVPFGSYKAYDPRHNPARHTLHNHFLIKALHLTRPGGLVVALTSRYTLDARNPAARREMRELADLVGAVRLPTNAHRRAAGTSVVTDLLILRRREPDQDTSDDGGWEWAVPHTVDTATRTTGADPDTGETTMLVNRYFVDHPERILGVLRGKFVPDRGLDLEVLGDPDAAPALEAALDPIIAEAVERGLTLTPPTSARTARPAAEVDLIDRDAALYAGYLAVNDDGTFTRRVGTRDEPYTPPPTQADELRQLLGLRDHAMALVNAEVASIDDTPEISDLRTRLNQAYDDYVAAYGPPSRYTQTRTMLAAFAVFKRWCTDNTTGTEHTPLPAAPDTVRAYLTHLRDAGVGADILTKHLDGITRAHQTAHNKQVERVLDRIAHGSDSSARERATQVAADYPDQFLVTTNTADLRLGAAAIHAGREVIAEAEPTTPEEVDLDELGLRTTTIKRPPQGGFRHDPFAGVVRALEIFDPASGEARKEDIFTQRVINPPRPRLGADTAEEALSICLDTHSRVDLDEIARLLGLTDPAEARAELGQLVFDNPDTGEVEWATLYLSGNVRHKLTRAREAAQDDPRFEANVTALEEVVPPDLGPSDIVVQLGSWIEPSYVQQFLRQLLDDRKVKVERPLPSLWVVSDRQLTYTATNVWGTAYLNAYELVESLLLGDKIDVVDEYELPDGRTRTVLNVEETELARDKAAAINDRFATWVFEDPDRASALMRRYNDLFNSEIPADFSTATLSTPGLASNLGIALRDHQIAAVSRMIFQTGVGLIHDVGAGKTLEIIVGVMERRRRGLTNKAVIVVRNDSIASQFERQWRSAYPQAQLLVATSDDFTVKKGRDKRAEFVGRVATGSWDAILITKDAFQRVPLSAETQRMFIEREVDDIRTLRKEKEGLSETAQKKTERALAAAEERLTARLDALPRDTKGLAFEQSGVDLVVVDEAQDFKNGLVISRLPDLGIVGSDRAVDLDLKLQWLAEQHHHSCAVLATATPFTGKFSEVYLWFRRLGHDLPPFDEWARNFIVADAFTEITPAGQLRPRIRMRRMINEDDLWTILRLTSDVRMADALNIPGLPKLREGGVEIVTVPGSVEAKIHSLELGRREREIRDNPRQPTKGADNHLVINHHGMQAALDLRIRGISTHEPQKVDVIADDIYREHLAGANNIYRKADGSDHPVRGGLILAFCDESIPRPGWNFYQELKDQLVARGMRENSIRFIHEAATPQAKKDLYNACRNGGVSLLIGSTQRMGAGLNVQDRLLGGYEIIPPRDYRADTSHQARGRVIRQGNQNETVFWKRVVLAPSLDAKKWEIVRQKHDLFAPLLAAHKPGRHRDVDDNESIDLADVMTAATGDPRYTEKAELDAEFKKLNRLQDGHNRAQQAARLTVADIERNLPRLHRELERAEQAATLHASTRGAAFSMTLQGNTITKRIDAAHQLNTILRKAIAATPRTQDGRDISVATLGGYTITAQLRPMKQHSTIFLLFSEASTNTYVAVDHRDLPDGYGLITRLENMLDEIPKRPNLIRAEIADAETTLAQARTQTDLPFPHTTRLADVSARRTELTAELSEEDDTAADTHVDPDSEAGKARAARLEKRAKERAELSEQVRVTVFDAGGDDPHSFADWYVAIVAGVPAGQRPPVLTAHKVWRELGRPGTVIRSGNTSASERTPGDSPHTDRVDATPVVDIPSELAWLAEAAMVSMVPARWSTLDDAVEHLRQVEALPWYRDMPQGWTSEHQTLIDEITEARKTHLSPSGALIAYKAESPHTGRQAWYVAHTASGAQLGDLISDTSFDVATATRNGNSTAITLPDSMIPRYLYALDHRADADGQRLDWTQDFAGLRAALAGWTAPLPVDTVGRFRDADLTAETRGMRTLHALAVLDTTAADPLAAALTGELIRIARWVLPTIAHTVGNRSAAPLLQALAAALSSRYPADTNGNTREAKALRAVDEDTSRVLTTTALWGFGSDPRKAIDLLNARIDALQGQHDPEPTLPVDRLQHLVLHIAELHTPEPTELERLLHAGTGSHLIATLPTEGAPADAGMQTWEITGRETAEGTHGGPAAQLTITRHFDTDSTGPINGTLTVDPAAAHPVTIVYDRPGPATDAPDHVLPALAAGHWMLVAGEQPQPESVDELHRQSHRASRAYLDASADNAAIEANHDISPTPRAPRNIAGHQAAEPTHYPQIVSPTTQNPTAADTNQKQTTPTTSPTATAGTALEAPAKPTARATGNRRQDEQEASQGQLIDAINSAARDADERYARAVREIARQSPIPRPSAQHTDQDSPADAANRPHRTDTREADAQASNREPRAALHAGREYAALDQQHDPQPVRAPAPTSSSSLSDAGHEPAGTQLDQAATHDSSGASTTTNGGTNQNDSQTLNSTAATTDATPQDPIPGAKSPRQTPSTTEPAAPGNLSEQQPSDGATATGSATDGIAPHLADNGGEDSEFKNADRVLTLHFSHQHGALLLGTEKADEIGPLLRSQRAGWKHSKRISGPHEEAGAWYLPQTHQQNRAGGKLQDFHHRLYRRITGAGRALADRGFTVQLDLHDLPDRVIDNLHAWLRGAQPTAEEIEHRARVTARVAAATERIRARVGRLVDKVPDETLVQAWTDFASEHLRDDDLATRLAARRRVLLDALPAASSPAGTSFSESAPEQEALETVREILTHETAARQVPYQVHTNKQRTEDEQADLLGAFAAYTHLLRERLTDTDELARYGAATDAVSVLDALGDAANSLAEFFDIDVPDGFPPPHLATLATQPPHPRVDLDALGETVGLPHWRLPSTLYPARLPGAADAVQRLPQSTQGGASAAVAALVWQLRDGLVSSDEATAILTRVRERDDTVFGFDRTLLIVRIGDVSGEITGFGFDLAGQVVLRGATLEGEPLVARADPQTRWTPGSTRLVPPPDRPMQLIYRGASLDVPGHATAATTSAAEPSRVAHPQPHLGRHHHAANSQTSDDAVRDDTGPDVAGQDSSTRDIHTRDDADKNVDGEPDTETVRAPAGPLPDNQDAPDDLVGVTAEQFEQPSDTSTDIDAPAAERQSGQTSDGTLDLADDAQADQGVPTDPVAAFGVTAEHPAARYVRESLARLPHDPDPERTAADRRRVAAAAVDMYVMTPEGVGASTLLRVIGERDGSPESVIPRWLELRPEVEWPHWVRTLQQSWAVLRAVDGLADLADRVKQVAELMTQRIGALADTPAAFQARAGTAGIRLLPADHPVAPPLAHQLARARHSHRITAELRDGRLPLSLAIEVLDEPSLSADELAERACYSEPHSLLRSWTTVTQLRDLADVVEAAGYTHPLAGRDQSAPALWRAIADGVAARLTDQPLIESAVPREVPELVPTQPRQLHPAETKTPVDWYLAKAKDGTAHREDTEASRVAANTATDTAVAMLIYLDTADPDRVQSAAAALQQHAADHALLHLSWALDDRHPASRRGVREARDVLYQLLWPEPGWDLQRVARRMITFADDDPARLCGALVALAGAWRTRAETGDDLARLLAKPPVASIADQLESVADHLTAHRRFVRPPSPRIRGEQSSLFDLDTNRDTESIDATPPASLPPSQPTHTQEPAPGREVGSPEHQQETAARSLPESAKQRSQISDDVVDTGAAADVPDAMPVLKWRFSPQDGLYMLDADSDTLGPWLRHEPVGWKHSRRITGPNGEVGAWYLPGTRQRDRNGLPQEEFQRRLSGLITSSLLALHDRGHGTQGLLSDLPQPIALDLMRSLRLAREAAEATAENAGLAAHGNTTPSDPVDPASGSASDGTDAGVGTEGTADNQANSAGTSQPATVDNSEPVVDEDETEGNAVIEGLSGVSDLLRDHHWDLVGVQPVDDSGTETEHWRRRDVSIAISMTPEGQVLTRLFIRHGPWESEDWHEVETESAQFVREVIEQAGLRGVARPARLPGLWRVEGLTFGADVATYTDNPDWRLVTRPADGAAASDAAADDSLDDGAGGWVFEDGTTVPLAPPLPQVPVSSRQDLTKYVLGDRHRDKELRRVVQVVMSGRAYKELYQHDARDQLAAADSEIFRRALTASVGQPQGRRPFDVARARQALERLAEGDPTLPLNSIGQYIEFEDWFSRVRDEEGAPLPRGVVVDVRPEPSAGNNCVVSIERDVPNAQGEIEGEAYVAFDAELTLLDPSRRPGPVERLDTREENLSVEESPPQAHVGATAADPDGSVGSIAQPAFDHVSRTGDGAAGWQVDTAGGMAEAALAWWDAGCSVVRVETDGSKRPVPHQWAPFQRQRAPRDEVATWFQNGHPGIGVVTGAVSGNLEMIEFEGRAIDEGLFWTLRTRLEEMGHLGLWEKVVRGGYKEGSPSGGMHVLYRVEGDLDRNTRLAQREARDDELTDHEQAVLRDTGKRARRVLIETRGEGGFVVVAPSHGSVHDSGRPWETITGTPSTIPTISAAERDILHMAARDLDQIPAPPPIPEPTPREAQEGVRPGDDFNDRASWAQVLEPHGWVAVGGDATRTYWRRPGKDSGVSAVTGGGRGDYLWVWSTSTALPSEQALSKWRTYGLLDHGGDFSAAARALANAGYGDRADHAPTGRHRDRPAPEPHNSSSTTARSTRDQARSENTTPASQQPERAARTPQVLASLAPPKPGDADTVTRHTGIQTRSDLTSILRAYHNGRQSGWWPLTSLVEGTGIGHQLHVATQSLAQVREATRRLWPVATDYGLGLDIALDLDTLTDAAGSGVVVHLPRLDTLDRDTTAVVAALNGFRANPEQIPGTTPIAGAVSHRRVAATAEHIPAPTSPATTALPTAEPDTADVADSHIDDVRHDPDELFAAAARRVARMIDRVDPAAIAAVDKLLIEQGDRERAMLTLWARIPIMDARLTQPVVEIVRDVVYSVTWREHLDSDLRARTAIATGYGLPTATTLVAVAQELTQRASGDDPLAAILHRTDATEIVARLYAVADRMAVAGEFVVPHRPNLLTRQVTLFDPPAPDTARPGTGEPRATEDGEPEPEAPTDTSAEPPSQPPPDDGSVRDAVTVDGSADEQNADASPTPAPIVLGPETPEHEPPETGGIEGQGTQTDIVSDTNSVDVDDNLAENALDDVGDDEAADDVRADTTRPEASPAATLEPASRPESTPRAPAAADVLRRLLSATQAWPKQLDAFLASTDPFAAQDLLREIARRTDDDPHIQVLVAMAWRAHHGHATDAEVSAFADRLIGNDPSTIGYALGRAIRDPRTHQLRTIHAMRADIEGRVVLQGTVADSTTTLVTLVDPDAWLDPNGHEILPAAEAFADRPEPTRAPTAAVTTPAAADARRSTVPNPESRSAGQPARRDALDRITLVPADDPAAEPLGDQLAMGRHTGPLQLDEPARLAVSYVHRILRGPAENAADLAQTVINVGHRGEAEQVAARLAKLADKIESAGFITTSIAGAPTVPLVLHLRAIAQHVRASLTSSGTTPAPKSSVTRAPMTRRVDINPSSAGNSPVGRSLRNDASKAEVTSHRTVPGPDIAATDGPQTGGGSASSGDDLDTPAATTAHQDSRRKNSRTSSGDTRVGDFSWPTVDLDLPRPRKPVEELSREPTGQPTRRVDVPLAPAPVSEVLPTDRNNGMVLTGSAQGPPDVATAEWVRLVDRASRNGYSVITAYDLDSAVDEPNRVIRIDGNHDPLARVVDLAHKVGLIEATAHAARTPTSAGPADATPTQALPPNPRPSDMGRPAANTAGRRRVAATAAQLPTQPLPPSMTPVFDALVRELGWSPTPPGETSQRRAVAFRRAEPHQATPTPVFDQLMSELGWQQPRTTATDPADADTSGPGQTYVAAQNQTLTGEPDGNRPIATVRRGHAHDEPAVAPVTTTGMTPGHRPHMPGGWALETAGTTRGRSRR